MQQAWHIFKKDVRYLYREIALLLGLTVLYGCLQAGGRLHGDTSDTLGLLYFAVGLFAIARLIHAEAIPGVHQFWVTRPYRWPSLLAAKILFVIAFLHLPLLLVQSLILLAGGFPFTSIVAGLLWTQVLIMLAVSLPCFALASMTTGMVPLVGTILALLLIRFVTFEWQFRSLVFAPESIEWIRYSVALAVAAIALPTVLYTQYKNRRMRLSGMVAAGVALAGALASMLLPWSTMFAAQSMLSRRSFPVEITRESSSQIFPDNISLPLLIKGVPDGVRLQVETYDVQLRRADGKILPLHPNLMLHRKYYPERLVLSGTLSSDRRFLVSFSEQPVTLRISFYLTLFGNVRGKTIPLQTTPVDALDGLRCFDGDLDEVVCRAPFRWPGPHISVKFPWGGSAPFTRSISYSPFPANLQLEPIVEDSAAHWERDKQSPRQVTIETAEPLAYLRRDIEVPNIHLGAR